jgi:hypothetical protein
MKRLASNESTLLEEWVVNGSNISRGDVGERIDWLLENGLEKIAVDSSGWSSLYVDTGDRRMWELTYPQSEMPGGGPRLLQMVTLEDAKRRFNYPPK